MKKYFILLILFFFVTFGGFAQSNSMLWKISGNGLKHDSYLFGTIHMLCPDDFEIKQKCLDALNSSDKVVFEVDLTKSENLQIMQAFAAPQPDFIKKFTESDIKSMDSILVPQQLSIKLLDYVSPVTAMSLFAMKGFNCPDPTKIKSFEAELAEIARTKGKSIGELETPDFQFNLLKDLITPKLFMESVFQLDKYPELTAKMVAAYKNENLTELTELIQDPTWMTAEQKEKLLAGRNVNWTTIIPNLIKEQSCFVAVGAGHLSGEKGLISLLREKGYSVKAIN
ncbi:MULTISPECIES: TraB/GumN family protein [Sphingobacterium]|uniref:TraB/GumN family protein n=1 Tax=Sphingobacterium TaxID=28453 RepID=UPI00257E4195|nr:MULTISPECIES: TraB/GumN family protein [Sphingobacterium]